MGAEEEVRTTGSWQEGRRVVELDLLAVGLKSCQRCSQSLRLDNKVGERRFGLGLILLVKCSYTECSHVNGVPSGSRHKPEKGGIAWDVNTKLAAGMT